MTTAIRCSVCGKLVGWSKSHEQAYQDILCYDCKVSEVCIYEFIYGAQHEEVASFYNTLRASPVDTERRSAADRVKVCTTIYDIKTELQQQECPTTNTPIDDEVMSLLGTFL